jgi:hypothetical protein
MQKLQNEEEIFLVLRNQLIRILRNRNKNVKKGLMNIMVLVRDVSCASLLEILDHLGVRPQGYVRICWDMIGYVKIC